MSAEELRNRLSSCPKGQSGWRDFEDICIDILRFSFVPPLHEPRIQARSSSGVTRRDAIFPNRITDTSIWGQLRNELGARMILFEFKNNTKQKISPKDVNQVNTYLTRPIGRLGIICSSTPPSKNAKTRRNSIYSHEEKVILFLSREDLEELTFMKERGDDPADLIIDMVELFYIEHE